MNRDDMGYEMLPIRIDRITLTILDAVAQSYRMKVHELVSQMLYRDAANMSGWPGQLGGELRSRLVELMYPPTPADDEDLPL